jgi:hypothetical protein
MVKLKSIRIIINIKKGIENETGNYFYGTVG